MTTEHYSPRRHQDQPPGAGSADPPPRDACGVFGIYSTDEDVARTTFFGLYALQHRGQESAGIAVSDGEEIRFYKNMGLVSQVFTEDILRQLEGHIAIGHNRYSTTGSSRVENAQPILYDGPLGKVMVAHNGNITNAASIRGELDALGYSFQTTTDSELIAALAATGGQDSVVANIQAAMPRLEGSYSLVFLTKDAVIGVRDPLGNRPLCVGRVNGAWVLASESCALETVGAQFEREVAPGEIVVITAEGIESVHGQPSRRQALCLFEYVYLARPDSIIENKRVYEARWEMGHQLAQEHPADADVVIGVPLSAITAAQGYAEASGLPYRDGLIHNRYIHRTFIQPELRQRQTTADLKYNAIPEIVGGKRVVVVDDSLVRGNSQEKFIKLLRGAGAREVHLRIHCPPLRHPCVLGVDMATYGELIAHRITEEEWDGRNGHQSGALPQAASDGLRTVPTDVEAIRRHVGADSLGYLSLAGLIKAVDLAAGGLCTGCWTGAYPVPVQLPFEAVSTKFALETAGR
ncbi:MAG: amidophosphoribosyltransferase [Dehalococcoidia bacterium]|nr:amidophosphoribosyltransferase [Dehalococcoidia bacterium]